MRMWRQLEVGVGEWGLGGDSGSKYQRCPLGELNGFNARLRGADDDDGGSGGGEARCGDNYHDNLSLGWASIASDRSGGARFRFGGSASGRGSLLGTCQYWCQWFCQLWSRSGRSINASTSGSRLS